VRLTGKGVEEQGALFGADLLEQEYVRIWLLQEVENGLHDVAQHQVASIDELKRRYGH